MATSPKASRGKRSPNGNGPAGILSVEQILEAKDIKEETVEVPEWGGSVVVRSFTKARQQQMREDSTIEGEIDENRLEMFMFVEGVIEPQFKPEQYEQLREKSAAAIDRVMLVILRISGQTAEAVEAAEKTFRPRR